MLGRKVQLKIVDDASSPNQVVTNYQTLISRDKVDLVFGPFSTLLTAPAARVASRYHYAFLEPSGGGPLVFHAEAGQRVLRAAGADRQLRRPVRQVHPLAAGRASGRRRPPTRRSTTRSRRRSPTRARQKFEAAGIKTVFKQVYPPEMADLTPIVAKIAAAKPDMVVRRHAVGRRLRAWSTAMVQLKLQPEVPVPVERRQLAGRVPDKVGANNVTASSAAATGSPTRSRRATSSSSPPTSPSTAAPPTPSTPARPRPTRSAR